MMCVYQVEHISESSGGDESVAGREFEESIDLEKIFVKSEALRAVRSRYPFVSSSPPPLSPVAAFADID